MKKIIILLFLTSSLLLSATNLSFLTGFRLRTYYHSNILKYSENDITEFKNAAKPEKFQIKSLDDFVIEAKAQFGIKHRLFLGHTQIDKLIFKYNFYTQNDVKNSATAGIDLTQFLRKNLSLKLGYYYYPDIYLKQYKSILDDTGKYYKFSYAKNYYRAILNYLPLNFFKMNYRFSYSQLFHNEYFTEFDADVYTHKTGIYLKIPHNLEVSGSYSYKISKTRKNNLAQNYDVEDASYESNIFAFSLLNSGIRISKNTELKLITSIKYEERFYQTTNINDAYHYTREDDILSLDSSLKIPLTTGFGIQFFYGYEIRQTQSPNASVVNDKEYSLYKCGLAVFFNK